ncbi:MAG TPA: molecular chaperone HscC [Gammaproteobacteria bacterium]|nr:molecular chaperone HscC [Gammaproteobacteria bacterium]
MTAIGIDLGTTYSLVAAFRNNKAELIPNVHGDYLTPSVVSMDKEGRVLIGRPARERLISHPKETAHAFKRLIGSSKTWRLGKSKLRPEELSALILKSLKRDAEKYLGEAVDDVVISVPAYFNDIQRRATQSAAQLAGLNVIQLVNEPTAGAMVYGLNDTEDDRKYMILDLGGGTFDITLLEYFDGVFEVHASAGDNFLGGEDFTHILAEWIGRETRNRFGTKLSAELTYQLAEQSKKSLSERGCLHIQVGDENSLELSDKLMEEICRPLLEKLRVPIVTSLQDADLHPDDLDDIVLVGGSTRMPVFREFVTRMFRRFPRQSENPDHVVAKGAAIIAGLLERDESLREVVMTDVMPYSMGIEIQNEAAPERGIFDPIIERNQTIPISRESRYYPATESQRSIELKIYQGESRYVENNLRLGTIKLKVPRKHDERFVDVRFTYDASGILEVIVASGSGIEKRLVIEQTPGEMSKKEIEAALKKLDSIKIHPRDMEKYKAILCRAERLYEQSTGEDRQALGRFIQEYESLLQTQDLARIERKFPAFKQALDDYEHQEWF